MGFKARWYKIGSVAVMAKVHPHTLRFWESEFPCLAPQKNDKGHRIYSQRDVEIALRIRQLLHEEGFTLKGAKLQLGKNGLYGNL